MSLLGKTIQLKGLSQKGKNRVRDFGSNWTVLAETDTVLFAPNEKGPWIFIAPVGKGQNDKGARWMRVTGDENFTII